MDLDTNEAIARRLFRLNDVKREPLKSVDNPEAEASIVLYSGPICLPDYSGSKIGSAHILKFCSADTRCLELLAKCVYTVMRKDKHHTGRISFIGDGMPGASLHTAIVLKWLSMPQVMAKAALLVANELEKDYCGCICKILYPKA